MQPKKFETGRPVPLRNPDTDRLAHEKELLIDPWVLAAASTMLIERYGTRQLKPNLISTAEVQIDVIDGENTQQLTVFAGRNIGSLGPSTVFIVDEEQQSYAPWVILDGSEVTDGNNSTIANPVDLQRIRAAIDSMNQQYYQAITETANSFDVWGNVLAELNKKISATEKTLKDLRHEKDKLSRQTTPASIFKITIQSFWEREGEGPYSDIILADSLTSAIIEAVNAFKKMHNRGDVQARSIECMVTADGHTYHPLPEDVIRPIFQAHSHADRERQYIESLSAE
ncbi:hypothetical protein EOL96_03630 [Candidatus Saccharibacteria bacterium]|nr:hypothetical protein [Candidatus Saccharibacteria bacterium]